MYLFYMIVSNQIANAHIYNSQTMARDRCPRNFSLLCTLYFCLFGFRKRKKPQTLFLHFSNRMLPPPSRFSTSDFKRVHKIMCEEKQVASCSLRWKSLSNKIYRLVFRFSKEFSISRLLYTVDFFPKVPGFFFLITKHI